MNCAEEINLERLVDCSDSPIIDLRTKPFQFLNEALNIAGHDSTAIHQLFAMKVVNLD